MNTSENMRSSTIACASVSLAGATRVLDAAMSEAGRIGVAVCVTIVDHGGEPVLAARMDGAPRLSADISKNKAWTVTSFNGVPSADWWDMIKDDPALLHGITHTPRLTVFAGGVPLMSGGALVGAIGVSGGSAEQDALIASTGASVII